MGLLKYLTVLDRSVGRPVSKSGFFDHQIKVREASGIYTQGPSICETEAKRYCELVDGPN